MCMRVNIHIKNAGNFENKSGKEGLIMRFQKEAWERYSVVQNQAKRVVRKGTFDGKDAALPVLESVLDQNKVAGEVDLGVVDIPVNQVVGIASDRDRDIYTSDFLPLLSIKSEFAEQWVRLFMEHLSDAGLANPIRVYEYLGKFYVVDGKKRVSVTKALGSMTIKACVTRIMPVQTDEPHIQSYYEFVKTYEKTGLYQIAFSQVGQTDRFLEALGYNPDHIWNETDRYSFMFQWYPFVRAMEVAFDGLLNITTADAVLVLLRNHSIAELRKLPSWTLAEMLQDARLDLDRINPDDQSREPFYKKAS